MDNRQTWWFSLLALSLCIATSNAEWFVRIWQHNLNFNNSQNWDIGRVPCAADRVIFEGADTIVIKLPEGSTLLRELVLSSYSEILLPRDGEVLFTGVKYSPGCAGSDAEFRQIHSLSWLDPHSWDGWTQATPDLERVPCTSEAVRFLPVGIYKVVMPDYITVGTFEINGQTMTTSEMLDFEMLDGGEFETADGQVPNILVNGKACPSSEWCECGNEYLHSEMCTEPCAEPLCTQPVQPHGFCCPICGVYILLEGKKENKRQLTAHLTSLLRDKGVVWHASKVGGNIQVVLVEDGEYTGEVPEIAEELKKSLEKSLGWTAKEFHTSGHAWTPTTFGQVIGHFFTLMVFVVLILASIIVFYTNNWSWFQISPLEGRPFVFARFENQSGEVIVSNDERRPTAAISRQSFDNPMYGATEQVQDDIKTYQDHESVTAENPMYTSINESACKPVQEDRSSGFNDSSN